MCIAISGQIVSVGEHTAKVNYRENIIEAHTGIVEPKVGDYCLVHAGCIVEIIDERRAGEIDEITHLLEEAMYEDNN